MSPSPLAGSLPKGGGEADEAEVARRAHAKRCSKNEGRRKSRRLLVQPSSRRRRPRRPRERRPREISKRFQREKEGERTLVDPSYR